MSKKYKLPNGVDARLFFGKSGGGSSAPPAMADSDSQLKEDEKDRIERYNEAMIPFEDMYNETPELFNEYANEAKQLYPERRERASALEDDVYNYLNNVNVLSDEFKQESQDRYDIRKQQGLESFAELYDPLERKITGKMFQNFGGLDNSAYGDLMGRMQDERAEGISEYINTIDLQKQIEETQQLQNQSNSLNNLLSTQGLFNTLTQEYPAAIGSAAELGSSGTALYNDLINAIRDRALQGAMMANQYNLANYQTQLANQQYNNNMNMGYAGMGASALGSLL